MHDLWYALPLLVVISLVYAATRHETLPDIGRASLRVMMWFGGFVFIAALIVYALDAWAY